VYPSVRRGVPHVRECGKRDALSNDRWSPPIPYNLNHETLRGMRMHPTYGQARKQLVSFLRSEGFVVHPEEVYCPAVQHCWVDVAALKGLDYWAFEYKSHNDSIKRGLAQCQCYSSAFNYVVLVADRHRTTSSPYFGSFKRSGFGVWSHTGSNFNPLLKPERRPVPRQERSVIERQFRHTIQLLGLGDRKISEWFPMSEAMDPCRGSVIDEKVYHT